MEKLWHKLVILGSTGRINEARSAYNEYSGSAVDKIELNQRFMIKFGVSLE